MTWGLNEDFLDILRALDEAGADYLVVGAHAMAVHGTPRATGDLDLFVRASPENAERVMKALSLFGAPTESHAIRAADFAVADTVYQIGLPPRRIDLMTGLSGVGFEEAWQSRQVTEIAGMSVPFLGREALVKNKRASGRAKDLADLELLVGSD